MDHKIHGLRVMVLIFFQINKKEKKLQEKKIRQNPTINFIDNFKTNIKKHKTSVMICCPSTLQ